MTTRQGNWIVILLVVLCGLAAGLIIGVGFIDYTIIRVGQALGELSKNLGGIGK